MDLTKLRYQGVMEDLKKIEFLSHKVLTEVLPELPPDDEILFLLSKYHHGIADRDEKVIAALITIGPSINIFSREASI